MYRRNAESGRPVKLNKLWDNIADNMSGSFWSGKGLAATCPFCYEESSSAKQIFLIRFEDGQFKGYSCFKCQTSGSGMRGISKLARQIGVHVTTIEAAALAGQSDADVYRPDSDDDDEQEEIDALEWPPKWAQETEQMLIDGVKYMDKRGILTPEDVVEKFQLVFSEVVEIAIGGEKMVKPFPCLVAPMAGKNGEVIGWTTRRIADTQNPDDPKAIALSGRGWKTQSLFGVREVDPRKPVTIVEGVFSSLSTPNSVAIGGKDLSTQQVELLAATGAQVFIFALDPGVEKRHFATMMYRLHLEAPGCKVFNVEWEKFGGYHGRDPNDRGWKEMENIIRRTVMDHIQK